MTQHKILASHSPVFGTSNPERRANKDFYPTPGFVTKALTDIETFGGMIWEPACGEGHMSEALKEAGYKVWSTDIESRGYAGQDSQMLSINFLKMSTKVPNIVTNPPFELAHEFVLHAKKFAVCKIAMLLRLQWLEGQKRFHEIWTDKKFPLKKVLVFSKRVNMVLGAIDEGSGSQIAYAWFIWDAGYKGSPTIQWIAPNI